MVASALFCMSALLFEQLLKSLIVLVLGVVGNELFRSHTEILMEGVAEM